MFRDFSFAAGSRLHETERATLNVSPTSRPSAPPPRSPPPTLAARVPTTPPLPCVLGGLAALRVQVDPAYQFPTPNADALTPPPSDDDDAFAAKLAEPRPQPTYSRISSAVLRFQRQSNTRMQCTSSHIKDISALVQKMVEDEEQCHVSDPKPAIAHGPPAPSAVDEDEDEGVDMEYAPPSPPLFALQFRRSNDRPPGCGAAISKQVRMRRKSRMLKRPSR